MPYINDLRHKVIKFFQLQQKYNIKRKCLLQKEQEKEIQRESQREPAREPKRARESQEEPESEEEPERAIESHSEPEKVPLWLSPWPSMALYGSHPGWWDSATSSCLSPTGTTGASLGSTMRSSTSSRRSTPPWGCTSTSCATNQTLPMESWQSTGECKSSGHKMYLRKQNFQV